MYLWCCLLIMADILLLQRSEIKHKKKRNSFLSIVLLLKIGKDTANFAVQIQRKLTEELSPRMYKIF